VPEQWEGVWVSHNRFVFKPVDRRLNTVDSDDLWYVPCGCDTHGDHLGCRKICRDLGCSHPLKVDVACVKLTAEGTEVDQVRGCPLGGIRPAKRNSPGDLRKGLEDLKRDLDDPQGPYRQNGAHAWSTCYHISKRLEDLLGS
jgi:hypothetical protein